MVRKTPLVAFIAMLATGASAPIPKEIAACSKWIRTISLSPSTFALKGYSGRGRIITADQLKRHIIGSHPIMVDPSNGSACAYMASISYDAQNAYGATMRETAKCTVLVREGQDPDVAITVNGDRAAWREFDSNTQTCARPVSVITE